MARLAAAGEVTASHVRWAMPCGAVSIQIKSSQNVACYGRRPSPSPRRAAGAIVALKGKHWRWRARRASLKLFIKVTAVRYQSSFRARHRPEHRPSPLGTVPSTARRVWRRETVGSRRFPPDHWRNWPSRHKHEPCLPLPNRAAPLCSTRHRTLPSLCFTEPTCSSKEVAV